MKTKYGEVKSIYDLFEKEVETSRNTGNGGDVIWAKSKCKICGDELNGMSELGAYQISMNSEPTHMLYGQQKRHIELHKTLNSLPQS